MTKINKHTITRMALTATFSLAALGACNNNKPEDAVGTVDPSETWPREQQQEQQQREQQEQQPREQPREQPMPGEAPHQPAVDVNDVDLDKFAVAYTDVQKIAPQYEERLMSATPEEATEIQREATEAVRKLVEKHDMTFERFIEVSLALASSPELQQRLNQKLQALNGKKNAPEPIPE